MSRKIGRCTLQQSQVHFFPRIMKLMLIKQGLVGKMHLPCIKNVCVEPCGADVETADRPVVILSVESSSRYFVDDQCLLVVLRDASGSNVIVGVKVSKCSATQRQRGDVDSGANPNPLASSGAQGKWGGLVTRRINPR